MYSSHLGAELKVVALTALVWLSGKLPGRNREKELVTHGNMRYTSYIYKRKVVLEQ